MTTRKAGARLPLALLLAALLLALAAGSASASTWTTEADMMAETNALLRDTFIYDPGSGYIDRSRIIDGDLSAYYNGIGFDRNFRLWARPASLDVTTAAEWSGCVKEPHPQPCPTADLHYRPVTYGIGGGRIHTIEWRGAYIALACGNFTRDHPDGPVPTISGVKYEDLNANDRRDAGEPGLSDWTMHLTLGDDVVATTRTDANGHYEFKLDANAPASFGPGRYQVVEVQRSGWNALEAPGSVTVPVGAGDHDYTGNDFGNYRNATIAGHKFDDGNVDGLWQTLTEPGVAGWGIGLSGDGSDTASTSAGGAYAFSVKPGTYTVSEAARTHWRQTTPGGAGTRTYTVSSGQVVSNADFGNVCLGRAVVDAVDDTTGAPVTGMEVHIDEVSVPGILTNDPALPLTGDTPTTFGDLLPGTYKITAFLPEGLYTNDPDVALIGGRFAIVKQITVHECGPTGLHLHLVSGSTPGKVTGGDVGVALDGGRFTSGFVLMTRRGDARGTIQFNDHAPGGPTLHTREIDDLQLLSAEEAIAWGHVTVDGTSVQFRLRLVDAGEPGTSDHYELWLATGYRAGFDGPLSGGNVQIHS